MMRPFDIPPTWRNFVDGCWVDGQSGQQLEIMDPALDAPLAQVALADERDIDVAMQSARKVVESRAVSGMRPLVRGQMLIEMGRLLRARAEETAQIICRDVGKRISEARGEALAAARYFEYFGGAAAQIEGQFIPMGDGLTHYVIPEPYGVVAHIIPWNYPHLMVARSLAPALAAGNANVIKAPELAPLSCYIFAELAMEVGFPAGAVNVLAGYGQHAGKALAEHPDAGLIVFTGSVPTGQAIMRAASLNIVPTVLELGGKSAAIVRPDADIAMVVENVRMSIFENAGQVCDSLTRLVVEEPLYDDVIEAVKTMVEGLSIGPGWEDADISPLISGPHRGRVADYCALGGREGARLVTGGKTIDDRRGFFHEPTVFRDVTPDMRIHSEEIFGPVLSIMRARDLDDAIRQANATKYGLAAGIFTGDLDSALWCAERLDAGQIHINEWALGGCETPFGGTKQSGIGRERGREGLASYSQSKAVGIRRRART